MLILSARDYEALIRDTVPPDFILDFLRVVVAASAIARRACDVMRAKVRRGSFANLRRAWVEQMWFDLGRRHPDVTMTEPDNKAGTASHVRARLGPIYLTENAVAMPGDLPRDADFRSTYARSPQGNLFAEFAPPPPEDASLYAMFLYGPSNALVPHFASIVVPNAECTQILARIRLDEELLAMKREFDGRDSYVSPVTVTVSATAAVPNDAAREEVVPDDLLLALRSDSAGEAEEPKTATVDDFDAANPEEEERTADVQLSLFDLDRKSNISNDNSG